MLLVQPWKMCQFFLKNSFLTRNEILKQSSLSESFANKTTSNKNLRFLNGNINQSCSSDNSFAFASVLLSPHVYRCKNIQMRWMSYPVIFRIIFCVLSKETLWAHHWQRQDLINVHFKTYYLRKKLISSWIGAAKVYNNLYIL